MWFLCAPYLQILILDKDYFNSYIQNMMVSVAACFTLCSSVGRFVKFLLVVCVCEWVCVGQRSTFQDVFSPSTFAEVKLRSSGLHHWAISTFAL